MHCCRGRSPLTDAVLSGQKEKKHPPIVLKTVISVFVVTRQALTPAKHRRYENLSRPVTRVMSFYSFSGNDQGVHLHFLFVCNIRNIFSAVRLHTQDVKCEKIQELSAWEYGCNDGVRNLEHHAAGFAVLLLAGEASRCHIHLFIIEEFHLQHQLDLVPTMQIHTGPEGTVRCSVS